MQTRSNVSNTASDQAPVAHRAAGGRCETLRVSSHTDERTAFAWIDAHTQAREQAGLRRTLRPRAADSSHLDLSSNDYLGLSRHPEVIAGAAEAVRTWGAGSTGSRLVTGSTRLHAELEEELADFCGVSAALVFSSGFLANLGALTALSGPETLIVSDAHNHASLIDGCRLSRAEVAVAPHADPGAVHSLLATRTHRHALVVTDSVFSVDGDLAPLPEFAVAARQHGAALVVDDAHGFGVLSDGRGAADRLTGAEDIVVTATLSKSLGAQGGVVLGSRRVVRHLVETARSFIFDTGLAPSCVAAALASVRLLRSDPGLALRARERASELAARLSAAGLRVSDPQAAVVSVRAPAPEEAVTWAQRCRDAGVVVGCFRPPSVPDRISRLRLTARADLTAEQLDHAIDVIVSSAPAAAFQDDTVRL
jgi:8-amino-7-oxononanoate synthase